MTALALASLHDLPALAIVETTKETFSGYTEKDRKEVVLVSDDTGAECRARIQDTSPLKCSDGRQGLIVLIYETPIGFQGFGTMNRHPLTIVIG